MTELPIADKRRRRRVSPIWVIPLLCFAMTAYFLVQHLRERGPSITIHFPDGDTLVPGKTEIKYLGVTVGRVTDVHLSSDTHGVDVEAYLTRTSSGLARSGTAFVVAKPEVSIAGVKGLTTIFSGSSLQLHPGDGEPASEFRGFADSASYLREAPGLVVTLLTPKASSLQAGDGVFYRGVRVGAIESSGFAPGGQLVRVRVKIQKEYARFVRSNSQFWETSGVRAKIGLFGAKIDVDSMQTLLAGGVSFATPNEPGHLAQDGAEFSLSHEIDPAWEKWSPRL